MILCEQVCVLVRCIVCERLRWSLCQRCWWGRDNILIGHVVSETELTVSYHVYYREYIY